jgi:hypothetical protein
MQNGNVFDSFKAVCMIQTYGIDEIVGLYIFVILCVEEVKSRECVWFRSN